MKSGRGDMDAAEGDLAACFCDRILEFGEGLGFQGFELYGFPVGMCRGTDQSSSQCRGLKK